jgi:hypothetical protein
VSEVLALLRKFLTLERVFEKTYPYYYNLFALLANQNIIFEGEDNNLLIEYTFKLEHPRYKTFGGEEVILELNRVK